MALSVENGGVRESVARAFQSPLADLSWEAQLRDYLSGKGESNLTAETHFTGYDRDLQGGSNHDRVIYNAARAGAKPLP